MIRNSHATGREKKGAGSAISAVPAPRVRDKCQPATLRQGAAVVPVALACSNHSQDALRCQPKKSKTDDTAGGISGQLFVVLRSNFSEPVHGATRAIFGRRITRQSRMVFAEGQRNFLGARIADVAFLPARLLLRRHSRKQPGNGIFAVRKLVRQNRRFGA